MYLRSFVLINFLFFKGLKLIFEMHNFLTFKIKRKKNYKYQFYFLNVKPNKQVNNFASFNSIVNTASV